MLVHNSV